MLRDIHEIYVYVDISDRDGLHPCDPSSRVQKISKT